MIEHCSQVLHSFIVELVGLLHAFTEFVFSCKRQERQLYAPCRHIIFTTNLHAVFSGWSSSRTSHLSMEVSAGPLKSDARGLNTEDNACTRLISFFHGRGRITGHYFIQYLAAEPLPRSRRPHFPSRVRLELERLKKRIPSEEESCKGRPGAVQSKKT